MRKLGWTVAASLLVVSLLALGPSATSAATSPLTGVTGFSAGEWHSCTITDAGGVLCWGFNNAGQLGDGTTQDRSVAAPVIGLGMAVVDIASGGGHNCVLTDAGGVKCWGYNSDGQLGDGTRSTRLTPVDVVGLSSGVVAVATGYHHSCALLDTGGVKCWGRNRYGQVGDGTTSDRLVPVGVSGLTSGVKAIGTGFDHSCAVTDPGGVVCWGLNERGQLGDGTLIDRWTPVAVSGLASGADSISLGWLHTCAAMMAGGAQCWGNNNYGQAGDGTTTQRTTPVVVNGLTSTLSAISLGYWHSCALTTAGAVLCWGLNQSGQLGDGTDVNRLEPVGVTGLASGVSDLATGFEHSCVVVADAAKCWGKNQFSQVGDGTAIDRWTPVDVQVDLEAAIPPPAVFSAPGLGSAVSGYADTVIAGGDEVVQVYRLDGAGWRHTATLAASDGEPGDEFGATVNLSGDFALVGAPGAEAGGHQDAGAAYVFQRTAPGTWVERARLVASAPSSDARFGAAVDSSAQEWLVIGSPGAGQATVFEPVGPSRSWLITAELSAPDLTAPEAVSAAFGTSAAINNNAGFVFVGAPGADGSGAVYAYRRSGFSWAFHEKLVDDPRAAGGRFGETVAVESTAVLIGAPGSTAIVGLLWDEAAGEFVSLGRDTGGLDFGSSIGSGAARGIAGDPAIRAAYVYGRDNTGGVLLGIVEPEGGSPDDGFGASVDVFHGVATESPRAAVVGAPGAEAIHLFDLTGLTVPKIVPGEVSVLEGDHGSTAARLPVSLSEPSVRTVTVEWSTADFMATHPADYAASSGTLVFAPGETEAVVEVTVEGDVLHEADELAFVVFRNPVGATYDRSAKIGGFYGLGFVGITDDDPEPTLTPGMGRTFEGDTATSTVDVPVQLSAKSGLPVTVDWFTADFTASAPSDYQPASGTVTIAPGETTGAARVIVNGDTDLERPEAFLVAFRSPEGATLGGFYGLGLGVILDDD